MNRIMKNNRVIPAVVCLGLWGLMQNDGIPFPDGREAHESYLLSLYETLPGMNGRDTGEYMHGAGSGLTRPDDVPDPGLPDEPGYRAGYEGLEGPEYAGLRDYIMTMDPSTRRIPRQALLKAARQAEEEYHPGRLKSGYMFEWEEIPSNTGGRTRALMYDPNDVNHRKVWAGGVTGGLWYRDDVRGVDTWKPVNDLWPSLAISCITYDPLDTETFYVGTGEGQTAVTIYRESSGRGSGIWKSSDAGTSWELLPSTEGFEYVTDIAIREESGKSVIYAGVCSGTYKGQVHNSEPGDGLFRSTDGGNSWTQVLPDIKDKNIPYSPSHIEISAGNRIFVGTMRNMNQDGGGCIIYSDDGLSWTVMSKYVPMIENLTLNNIPGRVVLAAAPSDANRIYAIIGGGERSPYNGFVYSRGVFIVRSSDGGQSWSELPMPRREGEDAGQWSFLAWHALTAAVQPNNPYVVWIGGLDLYRSENGGMSWEQKSLWWNFGRYYVPEYPVYVHADQHSLIFRPGSSRELLNSNDGGVFLAMDATIPAPEFEEVNQGYNTLQYYTCAIHPVAGKKYYLGGCQDNGTFRTTTMPTSKEVSVSYGDGTFCFIDENEPNFQITGSQNNYYYFSNDGNHNDIYGYNFDGGTFINPVDYDHVDNILYANGMTFEGDYRDKIFRISRGNDTLLVDEAVDANTGSNVPFSAMHVLPWKENSKTVVFAGSQSGKLYRLDNAQDVISSTEIGDAGFPAGYISCIQTGETSAQILVTFSNYGVEHVWQTTDGGTTWRNRDGNLPDMPVRWAIYPPGTRDVVMLATELGVWYTDDINAETVTWVQCGEPFPNVRVDMLSSRKSDNHILAGTHGRGLFLSSGGQWVGDRPQASPEGQISVFPNPASGHINVSLRSSGNHTAGIYTLSGQLVREKRAEGNEFRIPLEGLADGSYILRVRTGNRKFSRTFIKKE